MFSSFRQGRLIRLSKCPGWSESSLGAHAILLVLLCLGSLSITVQASSKRDCEEQFESHHEKTCLLPYANNKGTSQPAGPAHPHSMISVIVVRCIDSTILILSYPLSAQRRLWSDWADAQADLSLHWAHMPFYWFCREAAQILGWLH